MNEEQRVAMERQRQALVIARYMLARFRGEEARPPKFWTPEQVASLEEAFADPEMRRQFVAWALEGVRQYERSLREFERGLFAAMQDYERTFGKGGTR
jgi:hypothetical protein